MSNRALVYGGGIVAAGAAYYLYQAGGDPKAAEKRLERDASKLASNVRSELPGKKDEVKGDAKVLAADAQKKFGDLKADAQKGLSQAEAKLDQYRQSAEKNLDAAFQETRKEVNATADKFDKTVLEGTAKAKSTVSSWFGGSK